MNSNTQPAATTNQSRNPDLIVVPQRGTAFPNRNLTKLEQEAVKKDWANFGHHPQADNDQTWLIQVWHIKNGTPTITREITLPRQTMLPWPHPATHANNAASKPTSSAPQFA